MVWEGETFCGTLGNLGLQGNLELQVFCCSIMLVSNLAMNCRDVDHPHLYSSLGPLLSQSICVPITPFPCYPFPSRLQGRGRAT